MVEQISAFWAHYLAAWPYIGSFDSLAGHALSLILIYCKKTRSTCRLGDILILSSFYIFNKSILGYIVSVIKKIIGLREIRTAITSLRVWYPDLYGYEFKHNSKIQCVWKLCFGVVSSVTSMHVSFRSNWQRRPHLYRLSRKCRPSHFPNPYNYSS